MNVIGRNRIASITASNQNINFPADRLLDSRPKRVWKAGVGVYDAVLTFDTVGVDPEESKMGVAIFNTNAEYASVSIGDPNKINWVDVDWPGMNWITASFSAPATFYKSGTSRSMWCEFDNPKTGVIITVSLVSSLSELFAGVAVAGEQYDFPNPNYGLKEGLEDKSILFENSNGSTSFAQRDVLRTFSGDIALGIDNDFYTFMHSIARDRSYSPLAWKINSSGGEEWGIYARYEDPPEGTHDMFNKSTVNFKLIEVI